MRTDFCKPCFSFFLIILLLTLSACSPKPAAVDEITPTNSTISPTDSVVTPTDTDTPPSPTSSTDITPTDAPADKADPSEDVFAMLEDLQIGLNIGNAFDAGTEENLVDDLGYETLWSGSPITEEAIVAIKERGFNAVRIPVTWHNHLSGDDFIINELWLNRIQEVVDYVIDNDMYAILNIHHDNSPKYFYPSTQYIDSSIHYFTCIWTQLSKRFADYDYHLLFESCNEPRLTGTAYEWNLVTSNASCKDSMSSINKLNQTFVDVVRASGGNNATRYLMVPGYTASAAGALADAFELPKDTVPDKIIVSVHAYTPYSFALQSPSESSSVSTFSSNDGKSTKEIAQFMAKLNTKFIKNGIPVIIGEFGARNKDNNTEDRAEFAEYYVSMARKNGMSCLWWDNNAFYGEGENFGLLSRSLILWRYDDIIDAMLDASKVTD